MSDLDLYNGTRYWHLMCILITFQSLLNMVPKKKQIEIYYQLQRSVLKFCEFFQNFWLSHFKSLPLSSRFDDNTIVWWNWSRKYISFSDLVWVKVWSLHSMYYYTGGRRQYECDKLADTVIIWIVDSLATLIFFYLLIFCPCYLSDPLKITIPDCMIWKINIIQKTTQSLPSQVDVR